MATRQWDRVPVYAWFYHSPGVPATGSQLDFTIRGAPNGVKRSDGRAIYRAGVALSVVVGDEAHQDPVVLERVRNALRARDEAAAGSAFDPVLWDATWAAALPAGVFTSFYAQDDVDITPQGFQIEVQERFAGGRTYRIDLKVAMIDAAPVPGLNLAEIEIPPGTVSAPLPTYAKGQPGGIAPLDATGKVPATYLPAGGGTGGGTDLTSYSQVAALPGYPSAFPPAMHGHSDYLTAVDLPDAPTWETLDGRPAVVAAGPSPSEARNAIGAGTSNLEVGTGATDAKAGDWTPSEDDLPDLPASKVTGTLDAARIPTLAQSKVSGLTDTLAGKVGSGNSSITGIEYYPDTASLPSPGVTGVIYVVPVEG